MPNISDPLHVHLTYRIRDVETPIPHTVEAFN